MGPVGPRSRTALAAALVVALAAAFVGGGAQEIDISQQPATPNALGPAVPPEIAENAADWPVAMGNLGATRAALDAAIDGDNVAELEVAWTFAIEASTASGGMTAPPIVVGETVYVQDMLSNVFALDRASGEVQWEARYDVPTGGPNGVAIGYGMIYGTLGDTAEVFAVDAEMGEEAWRIQLSNNPGEGIDMVPTVYDNTVYVSTVPGDTTEFYRGGRKGILYALDAQTGLTLWQFDTTTDNLWGSPRTNSGGGLWYPLSVDEEGNLYFGVGNAAPWPGTEECPNASCRPGDNDYASSMVSLDANGSLRWSHNAKPHDLFDLDFQLTPIVTTTEVDGAERKVAIGAGKTGTVIATDADSGEVLWEASVGIHENDDLAEIPEGQTVQVFPGPLGGVETPIAYAEGRVFVPVVNLPIDYTATSLDFSSFDITQGSGELVALDAATGEVEWQVEMPSMNVGAATVANDVVFTGGLDGVFRAYDTETGDELWTHQAGAGINAPPAIAGDMVFLPAAGSLISPTTPEIEATPGGAAGVEVEDPVEPAAELIAFRLGGAAASGADENEDADAAETPGAAAPTAAPSEATEVPATEAAAADADGGGEVVEVDIRGLKYDPTEIEVAAGTTVRWTNSDTVEHTVTEDGDDPSFDSGLFGRGETYEYTFEEPGTFAYFCIPHPFMRATVVVT